MKSQTKKQKSISLPKISMWFAYVFLFGNLVIPFEVLAAPSSTTSSPNLSDAGTSVESREAGQEDAEQEDVRHGEQNAKLEGIQNEPQSGVSPRANDAEAPKKKKPPSHDDEEDPSGSTGKDDAAEIAPWQSSTPFRKDESWMPSLRLDSTLFPDMPQETRGENKASSSTSSALKNVDEDDFPKQPKWESEVTPTDPTPEEEPALGDVPPIPGKTTSSRVWQCITEEEQARAKEGAEKEAFGASSIPLGPFFWATRDRSLVQAMLVYWRFVDVDEGIKLTLLLPIFGSLCEPSGRWFVGTFGLWGDHEDEYGIAGYVGPYLYRRDVDQQSDVLFPFYWNLKEETRSTFIFLSAYEFVERGEKTFGVAPFYFGKQTEHGEFYDVTPVFARWGTKSQEDYWFAQTYGSFSATHWKVSSAPFYFGEEKSSGEYSHSIPLALTFAWGQPTLWKNDEGKPLFDRNLVVGPFYDLQTPFGQDFGLFPFWMQGEAKGGETASRRLARNLLGVSPVKDVENSYFFLPLLLAFHWKKGDLERQSSSWLVGQTYWHSTDDEWEIWSLPFYLGGHTQDAPWATDVPFHKPDVRWSSPQRIDKGLVDDVKRAPATRTDYQIIPPLLFAYFNQGEEHRLFVGQTFASWSNTQHHIASLPFWFHSRIYDHVDEEKGVRQWYDHVPLALNFHWGTQQERRHIVGPAYYFADRLGEHFGFLPFFAKGSFQNEKDGATSSADVKNEYFIIPALASAHFNNAEEERWLIGQTTWFNSSDRSHFASVPFFFSGRNQNGDYYDVIPPLAFVSVGSEDQSFLLAGPYFETAQYDVDAKGLRLRKNKNAGQISKNYGLFPLFVGGEHDDSDYFLSWGFAHFREEQSHWWWAAQTIANVEGDRWWAASFPFFLGGGTDDEALFLVPPLGYFHFHSPEKRRTHFLNHYLWRTENGYDFGAIPFYFHGRGQNDMYYDVVPPLAFARWGDEDESHLFALQTYLFEDEHSSTLWSFPFYFAGEQAKTDSEEAFFYRTIPLLGYAAWGGGEENWSFHGPVFDAQSETGADVGFAPFYFQGESHAGTTPVSAFLRNHILPDFLAEEWLPVDGHHYRLSPPLLYAHVGNDEVETTLWGPSALRKTEAGWDAAVLPPFYFGGATSEKSQEDFSYHLLPLFLSGHVQVEEDSFTLAGPWYDLDLGEPGDDDRERHFGLLPFFVSGEDKSGHYFFGPGFGSFGDETENTFFVLQTYGRSSATELMAGSLPFYAGHADIEDGKVLREEHIIPPLLTYWTSDDTGASSWIVGPWMTADDAEGADWALFPFVLHSSTKKSGLSPMAKWWNANVDKEASSMLSPSMGTSTFWLTPIGFSYNDDERTSLWAGPLYQFSHHPKKSESEKGALTWCHFGVAPFYHQGRFENGGRYDVIPPLFSAWWGDAQKTRGILGPLAFATTKSDADRSTVGLTFPLYFGHYSQDDNDDGIVLDDNVLAMLKSLPGGSFLGPSNTPGQTHVVPPLLFAFSKSAHATRFVAGTSYGFFEGDETHFGLLPIFAHGRKDSGAFYDVIPPLLFASFGEERNEHQSHSLLFAQTYWHSQREQTRESKKLWSVPFYFGASDEAKHGEKVFSSGYHIIPPLLSAFFYDEEKEESFTAIAPPLFASYEDQEQKWLLALTYFSSEHKRSGAKTRILAPVYFSGSDGERGWELFLPVYGAWHEATSQTRFLLTAFSHEELNGDYTQGVLPFYYAQQRGDHFLTMATPFYWTWGSKKVSRTLFLPTLTYASVVGDESFFIAPFVYHRGNPILGSTVVFPFYWHFYNPDADLLTVLGLWWDITWSGGKKRIQVAPGYIHVDDEEEDLYIAGPLAWSVGKEGRPPSWSFHVFPFFGISSYHPGHLKWRALLFAFGYERDQDREQIMIFGAKMDITSTNRKKNRGNKGEMKDKDANTKPREPSPAQKKMSFTSQFSSKSRPMNILTQLRKRDFSENQPRCSGQKTCGESGE
ncbi:MAG: hypothetical protein GY822_04100 [Deltaproteobacteria bacterium]|nr:hypothetical protein [Deltaproteobacteria bacterium]